MCNANQYFAAVYCIHHLSDGSGSQSEQYFSIDRYLTNINDQNISDSRVPSNKRTMTILLTIPSASTSCERSFRSMKRRRHPKCLFGTDSCVHKNMGIVVTVLSTIYVQFLSLKSTQIQTPKSSTHILHRYFFLCFLPF